MGFSHAGVGEPRRNVREDKEMLGLGEGQPMGEEGRRGT